MTIKNLLDERNAVQDKINAFRGRELKASEQRAYDRLLETRSEIGERIGRAAGDAPLSDRRLEVIQASLETRSDKMSALRHIDRSAAGRPLSTEEATEVSELRSEIEAIDGRVASLLEQEMRGREIDTVTRRLLGDNFGDTANHGGLGQAVLDAGFDLRSQGSVEVPLSAMEYRASTWPGAADLNKRQPITSPLGQDTRWLWPNLVTEAAGENAAVQDFRQSARTLTGTVKRALDATTDKAKLETTIALITEALSQFAVTIDDVPNQIFESVPQFLAFMRSEGEFQVNKAIDDHVMAQIVAAAPPFGTTGANLVERTRNGIATMRATGANPSLLVVNPTDAATLDLLTDAGGYIFAGRATAGSSNPLWSQRVIERIGAGTEPPYLIDPQLLGILYMGNLKFEADPYSGFRKNLTTLRVEGNALFHVRQAEGARRIAAS